MAAKPEKKELEQPQPAACVESTKKTKIVKLVSETDATVTSNNPHVIETSMVVPEDCVGLVRFFPSGDEQKTRRLTVNQVVFTPCERVRLKVGMVGMNVSFRVTKGMHLGHIILTPIEEEVS